jgi:hypothetical protein
MKFLTPIVLAGVVALAACSGNFATGTGMPNAEPPIEQSTPADTGPNGLLGATPLPNASVSPAAIVPGTYPVADAQNGFACPGTQDGYGCTLRFNLPVPTPSPAGKAKGKNAAVAATATPSPAPSPTPTPTVAPDAALAGGLTPPPVPSPSPTPPSVSLKAEALPKDAPPMKHIPENTLDVVPLMMVRLTPDTDFTLHGGAQAQFTLPKEQLADRGFALQLFAQTTHKKHTAYTPIWTFDKSTLKDTTLTFSFIPPKTTIAKGSTYALVLYGDDKSKASSSPSPSPSPGPSSAP